MSGSTKKRICGKIFEFESGTWVYAWRNMPESDRDRWGFKL